MKHLFLLALILFLQAEAIPLSAQNRIDDMLGSYSTIGQSTLTSAVERNKKTREIEKVVKVLEAKGNNLHSFISAFEQEKDNCASYKKTVDGKNVTIMMTTETEKDKRIYMLQYKLQTYNKLNASIENNVRKQYELLEKELLKKHHLDSLTIERYREELTSRIQNYRKNGMASTDSENIKRLSELIKNANGKSITISKDDIERLMEREDNIIQQLNSQRESMPAHNSSYKVSVIIKAKK